MSFSQDSFFESKARRSMESGIQEQLSTFDFDQKNLTRMKTERFYAYIDAVMGILATVCAVQCQEDVRDETNEKDSGEIFVDILPIIGYSFGAFGAIFYFWKIHAKIFQFTEELDTLSYTLHLFIMIPFLFLPYSIAMNTEYPNERSVTCMYYGTFVVIQLGFSIGMYIQMRNTSEEKSIQMVPSLYVSIGSLLILVLFLIYDAIASEEARPYIGFLGLLFYFLGPLRRYATRRQLASIDDGGGKVLLEVSQDRSHAVFDHFEIEIERINAFSDGIFAIVATLFTLSMNTKKEGESLHHLIFFNFSVFGNLVIMFVYVGSLWFIHHAWLSTYFTKRIPNKYAWGDALMLFFVALLPCSFTMLCYIYDLWANIIANLNIIIIDLIFIMLLYFSRKSRRGQRLKITANKPIFGMLWFEIGFAVLTIIIACASDCLLGVYPISFGRLVFLILRYKTKMFDPDLVSQREKLINT